MAVMEESDVSIHVKSSVQVVSDYMDRRALDHRARFTSQIQ